MLKNQKKNQKMLKTNQKKSEKSEKIQKTSGKIVEKQSTILIYLYI